MIKVHILAASCPSNDQEALVGGAEKAPYRIAKYLARDPDLDISFYHFNGPSLENPNCYCISVPKAKLYIKTIFREFGILRNWRRLSNADVLQIHHPHYALVAGVLCRITKPKLKLIVKAHGTAVPEFRTFHSRGVRGWILAVNNWIHYWHDRFALRFVDYCLCSSEYQKREMNELYGVPFNKLITVYNGFDPDYFPAKQVMRKKNTLLMVARPVPKKNIAYSLELFKELRASNSEFTLSIVAGRKSHIEDPTTYSYLVNVVAAQDGVQVYFDLKESELAALYSESEYFICPSIEYESIPSVIYEAIASECIVFSSYEWGIPEILPVSCALTLDAVIDSKNILNSKQVKIEHDAKQYSYATIAKAYKGIYAD
jgi:glycosyltransferase involved in cell wall biosynthesis